MDSPPTHPPGLVGIKLGGSAGKWDVTPPSGWLLKKVSDVGLHLPYTPSTYQPNKVTAATGAQCHMLASVCHTSPEFGLNLSLAQFQSLGWLVEALPLQLSPLEREKSVATGCPCQATEIMPGCTSLTDPTSVAMKISKLKET